MEENKKNTSSELTILDLWHIFRKNILRISITTFCFVFLFSLYAWFLVTPDFISSADVMVQVEQDSNSSSDNNYDLVNALRLIDTLAELMEKDVILLNAKEKLESLDYTGVTTISLRKGLVIKSSSTSYFINISFISTDSSLAKDAVDAVIDAVIEETDVADAFPVLANKIRRTSFASNALYNSPNRILIMSVGFFLGFATSFGLCVLAEVFSTVIKSKEEIEKITEYNVIGVIPAMNVKEVLSDDKKK